MKHNKKIFPDRRASSAHTVPLLYAQANRSGFFYGGGVMKQKRKWMPVKKRKKIFERAQGVCQICGAPTRFFDSLFDTPFDRRPKAGSVDHVVPLSMGGGDNIENLRWLCRSCNCSRGGQQNKKRRHSSAVL